MDRKIWFLIGAGIGFGIAYIIPKLKFGPKTNFITLPNFWRKPLIAYINAINLETGKFYEKQIKTETVEVIDEQTGVILDYLNSIPLYLPYGTYDISFELPGCLVKRLDGIVIGGEDIEISFIPMDVNNDGIVGSTELTLLALNWGRIGDEPVQPE